MLVRRRHAVGLAVAALALSTLSIGTAAGATAAGPTTATGVTASVVPGSSGAVASPSRVVATPDSKIKKCGTTFGQPVDNGAASNRGGGIDSYGAADFSCTEERRTDRQFSTVKVMGYGGDAGSMTFVVEVLKDCDGEPCDVGEPVCSSTGVGSPTGADFPDSDLIRIELVDRCKARLGTNWLQVQALDANLWFWRFQAPEGASFPADWKEGGSFGTGCRTYQNGKDMQECVFGGDIGANDYLFTLKNLG